MSFLINPLNIEGAANIKMFRHSDSRGEFTRIYRDLDNIKENYDYFGVKNVYHSLNKKKGTLRGFHKQLKKASESKIITCLSGKAYHVLLKIKNKEIQVATNLLSFSNKNASLVPRDCYSAFLTLEDHTNLIYLTDNDYDPKLSSGIKWNDPLLSDLKWPLIPEIISDQDNNFPLLKL